MNIKAIIPILFVLSIPLLGEEIDQQKEAIIEEIITTMGTTNSVLSLGMKKNHLRSLSKQLDGIGPLQFLGYIFSREDLKKHMVSIHCSSLKWNGFMEGVKPGLIREATSQELYQKLPGFATALKVDQEALKKKAEAQDWEGFVTHLVKN